MESGRNLASWVSIGPLMTPQYCPKLSIVSLMTTPHCPWVSIGPLMTPQYCPRLSIVSLMTTPYCPWVSIVPLMTIPYCPWVSITQLMTAPFYPWLSIVPLMTIPYHSWLSTAPPMTTPYCPWVSISQLMVVHSPINGSPLMSMGCPCLINQKSVSPIVLSSLINDFLGIYVHFSLMQVTALAVSPERATTFIGEHGSLDIRTIFVREEALLADARTLPAGTTFSSISMLLSCHLRQFYSWIFSTYSAKYSILESTVGRTDCTVSISMTGHLTGTLHLGFSMFCGLSDSISFLILSLSPSERIVLNQMPAEAFHEQFTIEEYSLWQSCAPVPWWEDTWFMMRIPLILGSHYGQNETLAFTEAKANAFHGLMW